MKSIGHTQTLAAVLPLFIALGVVHADIGVVRLRETRGPFVITVFTCSELVQGTPSDVSVLVQRRGSSEPVLDATVDLLLTAPRGAVLASAGPLCGLRGDSNLLLRFHPPMNLSQISGRQFPLAPSEGERAGLPSVALAEAGVRGLSWASDPSGATLLSETTSSQTPQVILPATRDQSSNKLLNSVPVNWPLAGCWRLEALVRQGSDSANVACELAVGLPTPRFTLLLPYLALPLLLVALFATNQWLRSH